MPALQFSLVYESFSESLRVAAMTSGMGYRLVKSVPTRQTPESLLPADMTARYTTVTDDARRIWSEGSRGCLDVHARDGVAYVQVLASTEEHAAVLWTEVYRQVNDRATTQKFVRLWHGGGQFGPEHGRQLLEAPSWTDIAGNYPAATRTGLNSVMTSRPPEASGRLLLWHGEPGTGKTTACTALIDAWYSWAVPHVVTDPERLFQDPSYLTHLMGFELGRHEVDDSTEPPSWNLIVCEDADEYLRADARERSGPALGRLLNATDGILGRASKSLILLSTNDPVGRLHPAVTRPGRCLSSQEFRRFDQAESTAWLGRPGPANGGTLAELYAFGRGERLDLEQPARVGAYL